MHSFTLNTTSKQAMININDQVQAALEELGVKNGVITVFCPHTSAGITINESWDPEVQKDLLRRFDVLAPANADYGHAEGNSDAHIKASLIGSSAQVLIENGQLKLGCWQAIYFCEFDACLTVGRGRESERFG